MLIKLVGFMLMLFGGGKGKLKKGGQRDFWLLKYIEEDIVPT